MKKINILLSGTSGFLGGQFLKSSLKKNFKITDILRKKNKNLNYLKKNYKNYNSLIINNSDNYLKKLDKIQIDTFLNFATFYTGNHKFDDITKLINANILFPTKVLDKIHNKIKSLIFFGSIMEFSNTKKFDPLNLYAATKKSFEAIIKFYQKKNKKLKVYKIILFDTFGKNDFRTKIIPNVVKNIKKNKQLDIANKNLLMNFISPENINQIILKMIENKIKPGTYLIKNYKNTKINVLIDRLNKNLKKKIIVKYNNNKIVKLNNRNLTNIRQIKVNFNLENEIIKSINENN
jgi:CDP-paratose synthetase